LALGKPSVRERYFGKHDQRMEAMQAFVGIHKRAPEAPDAVEMVRSLRRGNRLDRLVAK
jgi:hypothetical protein